MCVNNLRRVVRLEPATYWLQVQRPNHYATTPQYKMSYKNWQLCNFYDVYVYVITFTFERIKGFTRMRYTNLLTNLYLLT